jgi:hypothetical protein
MIDRFPVRRIMVSDIESASAARLLSGLTGLMPSRERIDMLGTRVTRAVAVAAVCMALLAGTAVAPAVASPAAQASSLSALKKQWSKQPAYQRKGTCATYQKYPGQVVLNSANKRWAEKGSHKNMTLDEWLKVYTKFFTWAC